MDKETPNKFIGESEKCEKTLCIQVTKIINTLQKSQSFQYIYIYIYSLTYLNAQIQKNTKTGE